MKTYFFMAGLPRAGATLLQAILNQNPDIHTGPESPVCGLIDNSLRFHADYLGVEPGSSYVNRDFLASRLDPQEINSVLQLYTANTISQESLLKMLAEGNVLPDEFDVEEEVEATQVAGLIEMEPPEKKKEEEETVQVEE